MKIKINGSIGSTIVDLDVEVDLSGQEIEIYHPTGYSTKTIKVVTKK